MSSTSRQHDLAIAFKLLEVEANKLGPGTMLSVALWRGDLVSFALLQRTQVTKRLIVEIVNVLVHYFNGIAYGFRQDGYGGDSGIAMKASSFKLEDLTACSHSWQTSCSTIYSSRQSGQRF